MARSQAGDTLAEEYQPEGYATFVEGIEEKVRSLPAEVQRRLRALRRIQLQMIRLDALFYKEVYSMQARYHHLYDNLYQQRADIISGNYEPSDQDCEWERELPENIRTAYVPPDYDSDAGSTPKKKEKKEADKNGKSKDEQCQTIAEEDEDNDKGKGKAKLKSKTSTDDEKVENVVDYENQRGKQVQKNGEPIPTRGIPDFWLTIFKNVQILDDMVEEHDEPILSHLVDIRTVYHDEDSEAMGFTLEFHFSPNSYFTNAVLRKDYDIVCNPNADDPFSFDGPIITACRGCTINWNKGKNVTLRVIKRRQKHRHRGTSRAVTKTVKNDSFFNFFSPPPKPDYHNEIDDDTLEIFLNDFEIGHNLWEAIIPKAPLYFTGEIWEDDEGLAEDTDDYEYSESEGGDDEDSRSEISHLDRENPADSNER